MNNVPSLYSDHELINLFISHESIASYGKYDRDSLIRVFKTNYSDIGALTRQGLADLEVIPIGGVSNANNYYYILNERWRLAKKLGTIESLLILEDEQENAEKEKRRLEYEFIKGQNEFQNLNNKFIEKQGELIKSQLATNEIAKTTNVFIAIFTFMAAIYYGFEFCKDYISDKNPNKPIIENTVIFVLGICGIWLLLLVFQQWRQAHKQSKP